MTQITIYIFTYLLHLFSVLHDDHYSVTNIDYHSDNDSIGIAIKINSEDLIFALAHHNKIIAGENNCNIKTIDNNLILDYISTTFTIELNKNPKSSFKFIRKELIDKDIWFYLSIPTNKDISKIKIMQALLFDVISNQVNLIIFSKDNIQKGFKTTFYNREIVIDLKNNK